MTSASSDTQMKESAAAEKLHTADMGGRDAAANEVAQYELQETSETDIDPENEVTGVRLLVVHIGVCLCTFLVGLVGTFFIFPVA